MQAECGCMEETEQAKETSDEVLMDDRKKFGMDSADPQNRFESRGPIRERLENKLNPRQRKPGF